MVTTTNELVIEAFNRLLAVCKASEQAFRLAAQAVHDSDLKFGSDKCPISVHVWRPR